MATRIQRPNSAPPSNNETPGPPPDLGGQVDGARNAVLSILKDTDWPKEASNDVEDLIRKIEAPIVLDELTKEGTAIPEELNTEIHQLLGKRADEIEGRVGKIRPEEEGIQERR
ncbi:hypothetical protein FRC00_002950 [Tulasnella sp. 408]|nr:hypothetical protein FRC00_002950 [Tulasnella sp. 408]